MEKLVDLQVTRKVLCNIVLNLLTEIICENKEQETIVQNRNLVEHDMDVETIEEEKEDKKLLARKKKVPFSREEDNLLAAGIETYGKGKWTSILNDPQYSFHHTKSMLCMRAKLKKLI